MIFLWLESDVERFPKNFLLNWASYGPQIFFNDNE